MKNDNTLIWILGGLGVLYFIKKRSTVPASTTLAPGGQAVQVLPQNTSTGSALLNSINNVIKSITTPQPVNSTQQPLPSSGTQVIDTPVITTTTDIPVVPVTIPQTTIVTDQPQPVIDTTWYPDITNQFNIPDASLAGYIAEEFYQ